MRRPRRRLRPCGASGRCRQQLGGGPSGSCSSGLARCGSAVRWSKAEPLVHLQPRALGWPAERPPVCARHRGAQRQAAAGCPRSDRPLQARHQGGGGGGRLGGWQGRGGGWSRRGGAGAGLGCRGRAGDGAAGGGGGGAAGSGAGEGGERVGARGPQSPHSRPRRRQRLCRHWQLRHRHLGRGKHRRQPPPAAALPEGAALAAPAAALSLGSFGGLNRSGWGSTLACQHHGRQEGRCPSKRRPGSQKHRHWRPAPTPRGSSPDVEGFEGSQRGADLWIRPLQTKL
mmetsp:Transcript_10120/g.35394  ORF Transcript_10120/g.35394 Transcript_10120/m.35394 type:complete len:285 (-) Transcript_10120:533-1387(-)